MTEDPAAVLKRINDAWRSHRLEDLRPRLHPDVVMVFPGFGGRSRGAEALIDGFRDFCTNAVLHEWDESDLQVDIAGDTATASFRFSMVYERDGKRYRSTGRDLWVFGKADGRWRATWRTMLDVEETEA